MILEINILKVILFIVLEFKYNDIKIIFNNIINFILLYL